MRRPKVIAIVVLSVIVIGIALGLALHVSRILAESRAVEISKQSSVVQDFLSQYPSSKHRVTTSTISIASKNHHCWAVRQYDPSGSDVGEHIIYVNADKNSWEIVSVAEAW